MNRDERRAAFRATLRALGLETPGPRATPPNPDPDHAAMWARFCREIVHRIDMVRFEDRIAERRVAS